MVHQPAFRGSYMTINDLGAILNEMYEKAAVGEKVAMIHLFGIKYAEEIRTQNYNSKDIIKASKIKESYSTELSKGMNLAKYVEIKTDF